MPSGVTLGSTDSVLTDRAAEFLATGPANSQALISHVCQLPGAPLNIAEHMAAGEEHIVLVPCDYALDQVERIAAEVLPALRPRRDLSSGAPPWGSSDPSAGRPA